MGHIILNWVFCDPLHLWPVFSDQTTYIPFVFLMFLTSISELIPSLWLSRMLLGVFGSSIYFISNPSPIISKRRCRCPPRRKWKWLKKWRRYKLHYWLVCHCRHRPKNRTPSLDVSFSSSPYCNKHRRRRRDRSLSKTSFKCRRMDEFPWGSEVVSKTARYSLMTRIEISCNFADNCSCLPSFAMLKMLLT